MHFPPGVYVSGSIRLRGNITLDLERGSTIEASSEGAQYDAAEPTLSINTRMPVTDQIVMILAGETSIRDVITFPNSRRRRRAPI